MSQASKPIRAHDLPAPLAEFIPSRGALLLKANALRNLARDLRSGDITAKTAAQVLDDHAAEMEGK